MRRPQIDPKTLRKHSRIVEKYQDRVLVSGDRVRTDYGYFVDGHKNKSFETKYMCIMPNGTTPKWQHGKKIRVLRVLSGVGHYETHTESDVVVKPITPGDEVVIEPGTIYRLRTSAMKLELFVTQDAKYELGLNELSPSESVAAVSVEDLQNLHQTDKTHNASVVLSTDRSMRRNLAREQIAAQRGSKVDSGHRNTNRSIGGDEKFFRNGAVMGINAMPISEFDFDGAG